MGSSQQSTAGNILKMFGRNILWGEKSSVAAVVRRYANQMAMDERFVAQAGKGPCRPTLTEANLWKSGRG
jgi:hypothetical protein